MTEHTVHPFSGLDGTHAAERTSKRRTAGLTMIVDWGLGIVGQRDLVHTSGEFFDFAKIAVGHSRLYPANLLTEKIEQYLSNDVEPFPGGQYLEYAEVHGKLDYYLPSVAEAGYRWVEVSDNVALVTVEWKEKIIRRAVESFGLKVLGEVGKKEGLDNPIPLLDNAKVCVDAGASVLLLEAAELVDSDPKTEHAVEEIVAAVGVEKVMFELPGPWIANVHACDIHRMRRELIARYGTQVNIGNVAPDDIFGLEAYRRGLGVNAGL
ncbi:MAG: phosphosulfolactate synthase [Candidatus Latescibacterota bacterium]|nr:phosphosulfolactate synthase [Candidatus Latescibacterota bacterium]